MWHRGTLGIHPAYHDPASYLGQVVGKQPREYAWTILYYAIHQIQAGQTKLRHALWRKRVGVVHGVHATRTVGVTTSNARRSYRHNMVFNYGSNSRRCSDTLGGLLDGKHRQCCYCCTCGGFQVVQVVLVRIKERFEVVHGWLTSGVVMGCLVGVHLHGGGLEQHSVVY